MSIGQIFKKKTWLSRQESVVKSEIKRIFFIKDPVRKPGFLKKKLTD